MTQRILALIDGSTYSASVCDHAAWVAGRTGAHVELLHILGRRDGVGRQDLSGAISLGARTALLQELAALDIQRSKLVTERGRAILEDAKAILTRHGATEVSTRLRHGDIVETVAEVEATADLIVIGKRGEAADFAKGHLGSNLERIVRASHKPVLVASRAFQPIETILVAFDGGASSLKAVDHIARDPLFKGLAVHVVTVGTATASVQDGLNATRAKLHSAGITAEIEIRSGEPESALGKLVDTMRFGMVVMGAYGHSRIRSFVIGSTTTEMIRSCKVPILLVR